MKLMFFIDRLHGTVSFFRQLTFSQLMNKLPTFMGLEISSLHSGRPAIGPYPEPDESNPLPVYTRIALLSSHLRLGLLSGFFLLRLTDKFREANSKMIISQLVKKFPTFYRTRMSITAFKKARHCSPS